jgi:hypothetical protein
MLHAPSITDNKLAKNPQNSNTPGALRARIARCGGQPSFPASGQGDKLSELLQNILLHTARDIFTVDT